MVYKDSEIISWLIIQIEVKVCGAMIILIRNAWGPNFVGKSIPIFIVQTHPYTSHSLQHNVRLYGREAKCWSEASLTSYPVANSPPNENRPLTT